MERTKPTALTGDILEGESPEDDRRINFKFVVLGSPPRSKALSEGESGDHASDEGVARQAGSGGCQSRDSVGQSKSKISFQR